MAAGKKKPVDQSRTEWVPKGTVVNGKPVPKGYLAQKGRPDKKVTNAVRIQTDTTSGKKAGETYTYKQGRTVGQVTKGQQTSPTQRRKTDKTQTSITGNNPPAPGKQGSRDVWQSAAKKRGMATKGNTVTPRARTGQSSSAANNMNSTQAAAASRRQTSGQTNRPQSATATLARLKQSLRYAQIQADLRQRKASQTAADKAAAAAQQKQIADLKAAIAKLQRG